MLYLYFLVIAINQILVHSFFSTNNKNANSCKNARDYYNANGNPNCHYAPEFVETVPNIVYRHLRVNIESYKLKTDDGYYNTLFRIPKKNPKGVILLYHALLTDSISYVFQGNDSLAFVLWYDGYDIWMNNQRGTYYSTRHVSLTMRDYRYWDFSFHEVAQYELRKQIKVIRRVTNNSKVIYFGHSLGTAIGITYSAMYPKEADEYFHVFIYAGLTCFYEYNNSPAVVFHAFLKPLQNLTRYFSLGYVFPMIDVIKTIMPILMRMFPILPSFGIDVATIVNGRQNGTDPRLFGFDIIHILQNISWKNVFHLFQLMKAKDRFPYYDYGPALNMKKYGSREPPIYPLGNITTPTFVFYSTDDTLTSPEDSKNFYNVLPDSAKKYGFIELDQLSHIDYFFGLYRKEIFYVPLLKFLNKHFY